MSLLSGVLVTSIILSPASPEASHQDAAHSQRRPAYQLAAAAERISTKAILSCDGDDVRLLGSFWWL
jgi:hypothetical protein